MAHFDPDPPFGAVLRRLRQERGFTIEEAARRGGRDHELSGGRGARAA